MADVFDAEKRSDIMRQVKSKKNKSTELRLIEIFKQNGITGWRRNYPVKGHPDFVFPKKKIAVFVDGCFWHGHDWVYRLILLPSLVMISIFSLPGFFTIV